MRKIVAVRITGEKDNQHLIAYSAREKNRKREFVIDITGMAKEEVHQSFKQAEDLRRDQNTE